ncbi:hypothetical protein [Marinomonas algicola]|jgi:hypothetical protein|uniref:hypothetical protein n=1 Tax=Marinomonas algicola TaxID=2773454 RepID=UPI0017488994|nr:hypothetical protein [Marinomonas algicola]
MESPFIKAFKLEKQFLSQLYGAAPYWWVSVAVVFLVFYFGAFDGYLFYLGDTSAETAQ